MKKNCGYGTISGCTDLRHNNVQHGFICFSICPQGKEKKYAMEKTLQNSRRIGENGDSHSSAPPSQDSSFYLQQVFLTNLYEMDLHNQQ